MTVTFNLQYFHRSFKRIYRLCYHGIVVIICPRSEMKRTLTSYHVHLVAFVPAEVDVNVCAVGSDPEIDQSLYANITTVADSRTIDITQFGNYIWIFTARKCPMVSLQGRSYVIFFLLFFLIQVFIGVAPFLFCYCRFRFFKIQH